MIFMGHLVPPKDLKLALRASQMVITYTGPKVLQKIVGLTIIPHVKGYRWLLRNDIFFQST